MSFASSSNGGGRPTKRPSWIAVALSVAGCLLIGWMLGYRSGNQSARNFMVSDVDAKARLGSTTTELVLERQQNTVLLSRALSCEANFQTDTILYEPGVPPSLPLMNGLIAVAPGSSLGLAGPMGARWVIPAKVTPRMTTGEQGFEYFYLDAKTEKFDGPYLPGPIQTGDKFLLGQLVSQ